MASLQPTTITGNLAAWDPITPGTALGGLYIGGTNGTANFGPAITFAARDATVGTAQAGIYVTSDGSYGTRMYFATTDSYGTGSKNAISISSGGVTNFIRARPTYAGNTIIDTAYSGTVSALSIGGSSASCTGNAANVTGTVAIANGGSGQTSAQAAMNAFAGAVTSGSYLRGNGTNVVMSAIQAADVPTLNQNTTGTAANVTGTVALANGGSGQTSAQAAMNAFAGAVTSGSYLRGNGTNVVMSAIQAADVPTLNQNTTGSSGSCTGNAATATNASNVSLTNLNTQQVSVGLTAGSWYTIAANAGDRASAKFTITDSTSGLHQAVHFYASAHFGTASGAKITVVSNTYYSGPPFGKIRIMTGGTYDGAMVQVYINYDCTINVSIYDNQQVGGWIIKSGVVSTTNPGTVAAFASLTINSAEVDLNSGKSFSVTDDIYIGGTTTQYKVLHANNYTDYTVTKIGVGASGSWGINITGSSASCTGNAATVTNGVYTNAANTFTNTNVFSNNVGIGTTIPSSLLHLYTSDSRYLTFNSTGLLTLQRNVLSGSAGTPQLTIINTWGSDTATGRGVGMQLDLGYGGSATAIGTAARGSRIATLNETVYTATAADQNAALVFFTSSAGALGERMRISSGGNVTITGTISASNFSGTSTGTNTGDQINITGNAATVTTNADLTGPVTSVGNATTITNDAITTAKILNNNVTYAKLQQVAGLSVVGNSTNSTATAANITGSANQVLRVNNDGDSLAFGPVNLSNAQAVSGTLPVSRGGTGGTTQATARTTGIGATTVGSNLITLADPGATRFIRINSDNTISALNDTDFRNAIGAGTGGGSGTVTSVATGDGLSGGPINTTGTITVDNTVVRTGTDQNITSVKTVYVTSNTLLNTVGHANRSLTIFQDTASADAYMTFHIGSDWAGYFGLGGTENDLVWGGWSVGNNRHRIMHSGNSANAWALNQSLTTTSSPSFAGLTVNGNGVLTTVSSLSAANLTGTVAVANGGSGQTSAQAAMNTFAGAVTSGNYLRGNGTNVVMSAIQAADITGTVVVGNGGTGATSFTAGRVLFGNGTSAINTNANLFWDNTNTRLGVGTTAPAYTLDVGGACHASSFPTSSDVRFKKNIQPLTNALQTILSLRGVKYEWNNFIHSQRSGYELNAPVIGMIAQEVENVIPEIVGKWALNENFQDARSLEYQRIIPYLIEAVKELDNKNKILEARILALENK